MSELAELKLDMLLQQILDLKGDIRVLKESLNGPKRITLAQLAKDEGIHYDTAKNKYRDRIVKGSRPIYVDLSGL